MRHAGKSGAGADAGSSPAYRGAHARFDQGLRVFALEATVMAPSLPVTDESWARSIRRFAQAGVWTVPVYAVVYGVVTLGSLGGGVAAPHLADGGPMHLVGWLSAVWLGLMALMSIAGVLAPVRSRRIATAGLMVGIAGAALMLPFAALPKHTSVYGSDARTLALAGAAVYSLGWLVMGSAVLRSGVFMRTDGVLLMVAAPMLGIAGLLIGPLQTVGALLTLAAGIGVAWAARRLSPPADSVGAAAGAGDGPAAPDPPGSLATP